ncbi:MAG: hypothetical protein ACUVWZ_16485 [Anaerolineae bacterium]
MGQANTDCPAIKRAWRAFSNFARHPAIGMVVVAAVAFFVYRDAVGFLFFNDDPTGHFRWMEDRSIVSFFVSARGHAYYRPLSFVLWQALHAVLGYHDPFLLHFLNVIFHAANCALIWLLAYRLSERKDYAFMAAVLFGLYPFSYEAVAYVGAFVHPLTTFFVLATLVLYREARHGVDWSFYGSHLTLVLALFTQENAVVTPLLLIAWELIERGRAFDKRSLTYLIEPLLFLALWLRVPKLPTAGLQPVSNIGENALHFLQAVVYPVAPLASTMVTRLPLSSPPLGGKEGGAVALVAVALASFLVLYVAGCRARRRSFSLSLAWVAFSALPAVLFLESAYVSGSPRLFYLTSVGAALLWATLPLSFLPPSPPPLQGGHGGVRKLLAWAMVAALAWSNLGFINCRLSDFARTTELMRLMAETAQTTPAGRELTYINLPFHFSSTEGGCAYPYLYGSAGAVAIPLYADLADFIAFNGGPRRQVRGVVVREFQPGWATYGDETDLENLRALLAKGQVYLFDFFGWEFFDLTANWLVSPQAGWEEEATLGEIVVLADHSVEKDDGLLKVTLWWKCLEQPERRYTVFLHLYNADGKLVAQKDSQPASNHLPTVFWRRGDVVRDQRAIELPVDMPHGRYTIAVGLYDPQTMVRLPAVAPDGTRWANDAVVLEERALP